MWKKGELVWVSFSDTWIPGRILDPYVPVGVLVSFFDLMEPRYVPKPCLRSFHSDFETVIADSGRFFRFVNRALRAHFWNISFGLWCSCQPSIESPYFDRENSLPCFPHSSHSALRYVRRMAVPLHVPLRSLAKINSSSAEILSFRRYAVDFKRSESVYEEIRASAKLMDRSEESDWFLDPSNKMECIDLNLMFHEAADSDIENSRNLTLSDPFPEDIHCYSSPSFVQPADKVVQISTWNTRNPLTISNSSTMKACETIARTALHEVDGHRSKSKECCQVDQSICFLNFEPSSEDMLENDTSSVTAPRVALSEALPDVNIETHNDIIGLVDEPVTSTKQLPPLLDGSNDKAYLAKPVYFVPGACRTLACSVRNKYTNPRNKLDSSIISANTLNVQSLDRNSFNRTRENCSDNTLESHIVDVEQVSRLITSTSNKDMSSDDAEQLQNMEAGTTVEKQTRSVGNERSIGGVKRKARQDKASARNSKRKKKAGQQSISTDKSLNLHLMRLANPKCLRMKFLSRHGNLPSKSDLLKRFSVFGKIDASRTDVSPEESSAKVVFMQSIDAVTAYQFARSKKFWLGWCKVTYRLDPFEEDNEVNKVPSSQKPQTSVPSPKSCLKKHGSVDKKEGRRNLKVKFQMETN